MLERHRVRQRRRASDGGSGHGHRADGESPSQSAADGVAHGPGEWRDLYRTGDDRADGNRLRSRGSSRQGGFLQRIDAAGERHDRALQLTPGARVPAGSYSLSAIARDSDGGSTSSATVSVTVTGAVGASRRAAESGHRWPGDCGQCPTQWRHVYGSRRRRGHLGDQRPVPFRLSAFTGDVVITARVASVQAVDPWTKAGVMIRETLTAGSRHAFAHRDGRNWLLADAARQHFGHLQPHRRRIERPGTRLGPLDSPRQYLRNVSVQRRRHLDRLRLVQITMASTVYIGLAVTSHNASTATTAVFDNLSVTTPTNQPPSVVLDGAGQWVDVHGAGDDHAVGDGVRSRKPAGEGRLLQRIDAAGERHDRALLVSLEQRCGRDVSAEGRCDRC